MTEYLYVIKIGLSIQADSEQEAEQKARDYETGHWTLILDDGVEVWESEVCYKGKGCGE